MEFETNYETQESRTILLNVGHIESIVWGESQKGCLIGVKGTDEVYQVKGTLEEITARLRGRKEVFVASIKGFQEHTEFELKVKLINMAREQRSLYMGNTDPEKSELYLSNTNAINLVLRLLNTDQL